MSPNSPYENSNIFSFPCALGFYFIYLLFPLSDLQMILGPTMINKSMGYQKQWACKLNQVVIENRAENR